jgi:8-oxo-dGTP pyrophosphatase MutT (NUDIX family)
VEYTGWRAVEKGESLFDALKREIREECDILISEGIPFLILDKIYKKDHKIIYHYVIIDFLIKKFSGSLHTGSDSIDLKFFDLEDLNNSDISKSVSKLRESLEFFLLNGKLTYLSFKEW